MKRNKKGQSALEYAALITLLAVIVFTLVYNRNSEVSLHTKVNTTYTSVINKVGNVTTWYNETIR